MIAQLESYRQPALSDFREQNAGPPLQKPELENTPKNTVLEPAVTISLSEEAKVAMSQPSSASQSEEDEAVLPDVLLQATRRDASLYRARLTSIRPWTPETQVHFDRYVQGTLLRANQAFDLVHDAVSTDGLDLNNPDHKEVYEKAVDSLFATAYRALENENAFVDGPGADDMRARDFISMLRNTTIVFKGGTHSVPAEYDQANRRITIWPTTLVAQTGSLPRDTAINSVLFHEIGHAVGSGRTDSTNTWTSFYQNTLSQNPTWSTADIELAYSNSNELRELERRTSARGWGLSEIAGLVFDPNIHQWGVAPR